MQEFESNIKLENLPENGEIYTTSPSNIALIKYWGKKENQIPTNASISFTLNNCHTKTKLVYTKKEGNDFSVKVFFEGKENEKFAPKIIQFFERIETYVPFLRKYDFEVHTENTFPHSSGIASSASGLSAMAKCLVQMEQDFGSNLSNVESLKKASFLARLGSGSASRSIYPGLVVWGKHNAILGSSDEYAIPYTENVHPVFQEFNDVILLVHDGEKSMSSTAGHNLMNNHPYAEQRFKNANENLSELLIAIKDGNLEEFGTIVEHEALSLHAMMLTSSPAYILMEPNTLAVLKKVWQFRAKTNLPLYFTLDAGANVHLLFPNQGKDLILEFIEKDLSKYCVDGRFIVDNV